MTQKSALRMTIQMTKFVQILKILIVCMTLL